jgi:pimeloyl-ACP methyl ester carboxylesterase
MDGVSDWDRGMLVAAIGEALVQGPGGLVDDLRTMVRPWGSDVGDIAVATRIMVARDDPGVPSSHGQWLVDHIAGAELVVVAGGHFGPRDEEEESLMAWLASGNDKPADQPDLTNDRVGPTADAL